MSNYLMTSEIENIFNYCAANIDILRERYHQLKNNTLYWPEKNIYDGDWKAVLLRYDHKQIASINSEFDSLLSNSILSMFSVLESGTKILRHKGHPNYCEHIIRCHFCIEASEDNALVVGDDIIRWEAGKGYTFDDSIEHYGWNNGTKDRIILFFDIPKTKDIKVSPSYKMKNLWESNKHHFL